jgi:P-type Ca2+ transporter type 2C
MTAPSATLDAPDTAAAWHAADIDRVLAELATTRDGLSEREAATRLTTCGPNRIPVPSAVSAASVLGRQLRSVVVALLTAAAILSLAIGDRLEAAAIAAVLVINAALGFATEWRARRAMEALLRLEASRALVRRAGRLCVVAADTVVPGDVVQLDAGNTVPADVRIFEAVDLSAEEAALTGEALPSEKATAPMPAATELADRANMAYMGTTIATGSGLAVVVATGQHTELGRIGRLVNTIEEEPTPLERRLDTLGRRLVWATLGIAGVVATVGVLNGLPRGLVLETAIALAVAAMPEALPAVATIALAVGMHRMARRHALVRRLPSVESLGSATVVCTDKTRTLTTGEMTVVRVWTASGEFTAPISAGSGWPGPASRVLEIAARATQPQADAKDGSRGVTNPVDVAILATLPHLDAHQALPPPARRAVLPFSSARKMMATFDETTAGATAAVKGALVAVLPLCTWLRSACGPQSLDHQLRARLHEIEESLARTGLRMLAVATGTVAGASAEALQGLTFEGLLAIADPVAKGVPETVALLRRAGLRTIMITGDQRGTAEAVGRAVGLFDGASAIIEGRELTLLSPGDLAARLGGVHVFSRVSPEHKLLIVEALQQRGDIVAMLGDGVNDAAALKKADVGVAMGVRGTDVAKQAAAIVLQDDRFETVAAAVEEGRVIFDNIRKFVFYLFSCNVAEVLVLLIAGVAGKPLPLTPLQLLWLNMVTDTFPALALAMEPGDATVMQRPPRDPHEAILSSAFVTSILLHATVITLATLAAFWWALQSDPAHAPTIAFMTLAFAQILHLGNARSDRDVLARIRALANPFALAAVAVAAALQAATALTGLSGILAVVHLDAREWLVIAGCASAPAFAGQTLKLLRGPR